MQGADWDELFAAVARAPWRLLVLDYDGTLAPLRAVRDEAVPYPGVRRLLATILAGAGSRLVIVTGRAISDAQRLLSLRPPPEIWGCHGWEHALPGGMTEAPPLPDGAREGLSFARAALTREGLAARVEVKAAGLGVHWRGLPDDEAARIERVARRCFTAAVGQELELLPFHAGVELRARGRDKGWVMARLLAEAGSGAIAVFLGDDQTDEDAFRVLAGRGVGILASSEQRPTAAALRLTPPADLLEFLTRWHEVTARNAGKPGSEGIC